MQTYGSPPSEIMGPLPPGMVSRLSPHLERRLSAYLFCISGYWAGRITNTRLYHRITAPCYCAISILHHRGIVSINSIRFESCRIFLLSEEVGIRCNQCPSLSDQPRREAVSRIGWSRVQSRSRQYFEG